MQNGRRRRKRKERKDLEFEKTHVRTNVAFAARPIELAWWLANKFPMHRFADTFDDVISTAVATGALASGTASSALVIV